VVVVVVVADLEEIVEVDVVLEGFVTTVAVLELDGDMLVVVTTPAPLVRQVQRSAGQNPCAQFAWHHTSYVAVVPFQEVQTPEAVLVVVVVVVVAALVVVVFVTAIVVTGLAVLGFVVVEATVVVVEVVVPPVGHLQYSTGQKPFHQAQFSCHEFALCMLYTIAQFALHHTS